LVASLPVVHRNNEGKIVKTISDYATYMNSNYNRLMNLLNNDLATLTTLEDMLEKIKQLSTKNPELEYLLDRLEYNSNNISDNGFLLRNAFYTQFSNNRNTPMLLLKRMNGAIVPINAMSETLARIIRQKWLNNAKMIANAKDSWIRTNSNGDYVINMSKINEAKTKTDFEDLSLDSKLRYLVNLGFSINITDINQLNDPIVDKFFKWFGRNINKDMSLNDMFNKNIGKINQEIREMLEFAGSFESNDIDLTYFNQDGETEWSIALNGGASNTFNKLNKLASLIESGETLEDIDIEEFKNLLPRKFKGNATFSTNSKIVKAALEGKRTQFILLKGIKEDFGDGFEVTDMKEYDYTSFLVNHLLDGTMPFLRMGDRRLEYAIRLPNARGEYRGTVENETIKDSMLEYLKDELALTFKNLKEDLNTRYVGNNLSTLRVFNFIWSEKDQKTIFENFKNSNPDLSVEELSQQFTEQYHEEIDSTFDTYIQDNIDETIQYLESAGLVAREGTDTYYISDISPELLTEFSEKFDGVLNSGEMSNVAKRIFYNYFVGANEQLRLVYGDLAGYKDIIDFHKRTTGAGSTRKNTRNDDETIRQLNVQYPRMDNAQHTKTPGLYVLKDIVTENSELSTIYKKYNKIEGTDAQSHITLDEYRGFKVRQGEWTEDQEKAYQYEQQLLGIRLINNPNKNFEFTEGNFLELFGQHVRTSVPEQPMFNGEIIKPEELGQLPPIKPIGYGKSEEGDFVEYFKTSTTPILPSTLKDGSTGMNLLLNMMNDGVSYAGFVTTQKATFKGEPIDITNLDSIESSQKENTVNYDNFGEQLDIHDEFKNKVTQSTQMVRLLFGDIFGSELDQEFKPLKEERDKLTNAITRRVRNQIIDELGLTYNSKTEEYSILEENKSKFKDKLIDLFHGRQLPQNAIEGIDIVLDTESKLIDTLVNKNQIENVLFAFVRNSVISNKVPGEMLIQESSAIYDEDLKFYTNKDGKVTEMEVMIPLPNSLVRYVKQVGGLEEFNKMVQGGAIDAMDPRILTLSANRIPAQGLNSLEAIRVKKFLPQHVGAKIVLPADIVVKTGSDFDVDKLTTYYRSIKTINGKLQVENYYDKINKTTLDSIYFYKYGGILRAYNEYKKGEFKAIQEVEEFKELFPNLKEGDIENLTDAQLEERIKELPTKEEFVNNNLGKAPEEVNTLNSIYNRLLEINNEAVLHPVRFDSLIKPNNADTLQSLANELKVRSKSPLDDTITDSWSHGIKFWYNAKRAMEYFSGKAGIGMTATANVSHVSTQENPLKVVDKAVNIFFKGQQLEEDQNYKIGHINDIDGKKISDIYAEFLTAFVDVAKDPFILYLNANTSTFNAFNFLMRTGVEKGPTDIKTLARFFTQPVILDYLKQRSIDEHADQDNKVKDTVSRVAEKYGFPTVEMQYEFFDDYLNNRKKVTSEEVEALNKKFKDLKYKHLTKTDLQKTYKPTTKDVKMNMQILDNFLMYVQFGRILSEFQKVTRPDVALGKNRAQVRRLNQRRIKFGELDFFDRVDYNNFMSNSYLNEYSKTHTETFKLFKNFFITGHEEILTYLEGTILKPALGTKMSDKRADKFLHKFENQLTNWILGKELSPENYEYLLVGKNSVPTRILKAKTDNQLRNNLLIKELLPLIKAYDTGRDMDVPVDNVKLYQQRLTVEEQDNITEAWAELLESEEDYIRKLGKDLMSYMIAQGGVHNSPINFYHLIPNRYFQPIVNDIITTFLNKAKDNESLGDELHHAIDDIIRNNANDTNLVVRFGRKGTYLVNNKIPKSIDVSNKYAAYDEEYISKVVFLDNKRDAIQKFRQGINVPKEIVLYQKARVEEDFARFELVPKLGYGYRFFETTETVSDYSVLDINNSDTRTTQEQIVDDTVPIPEDVSDINAEISSLSRKDRMMSFAMEGLEANEDLNNSVEEFFKAIGVDLVRVKEILDAKGKPTNAVAAANFINKTIEVVDGKDLKISQLPEEAAHWYVAMLGEDNNLYKGMLRNITKYDTYKNVVKQYSEIYEGDETLLKQEAIGKVIANEMVGIHETTQSQNWWKALWNKIKGWFSKSTPFKKAAYDILNNNLTNLKESTEVVESPKMYSQESNFSVLNNWENFPGKVIGNTKVVNEYYRESIDRLESRAIRDFGSDAVSVKHNLQDMGGRKYHRLLISKPTNKNATQSREVTSQELTKENATIQNQEYLLENFDSIFPNYDFFSTQQKLDFIEQMSEGQLEIYCGL